MLVTIGVLRVTVGKERCCASQKMFTLVAARTKLLHRMSKGQTAANIQTHNGG